MKRNNDNESVFATSHAGYVQHGLSKREYVIVSVSQGMLASGQWKGIEQGFLDRVEAVTDVILNMMHEKA